MYDSANAPHYGATVYDVTLTSLASHTSLTFYLITPKDLALQPLPSPPQEPAREESWDDEDKDFHLPGLLVQNNRASDGFCTKRQNYPN